MITSPTCCTPAGCPKSQEVAGMSWDSARVQHASDDIASRTAAKATRIRKVGLGCPPGQQPLHCLFSQVGSSIIIKSDPQIWKSTQLVFHLRIGGVSLRDRVRNQQILLQCGTFSVDSQLRSKRLRWFGHIVCHMSAGCLTADCLNCCYMGK